jgi:pimeloyl-ACP methyl ester carboxylesterase
VDTAFAHRRSASCRAEPGASRRVLEQPGRIVALHASASSAKQWRPLERRLAGVMAVSACDHIGHGDAPAWQGRTQPSLADHVAGLAPHIGAGDSKVHLVGHSFGGVVALQFALEHPQRVASLVLYEPVLLSVLSFAHGLMPQEREVHAVADDVRRGLAQGQGARAAERFITYWGGESAWARLDARQQAAVVERMPAVAGHFDVIQGAHALARRLADICIPTLLLQGGRSTPSAQRVAAMVAAALPQVQRAQVDGAGHMGPVTHAAEVNELIAAFVAATPHSISSTTSSRTEP